MDNIEVSEENVRLGLLVWCIFVRRWKKLWNFFCVYVFVVVWMEYNGFVMWWVLY